jgi:hypothetical protein
VKHRSPLVTLAAVAVAFAIMFIVNMLSGPPGNSSVGLVTTTAGSPAPQQCEPVTNRWMVLEDGSRVGVQTTGTMTREIS